jgi:hypothetical protein
LLGDLLSLGDLTELLGGLLDPATGLAGGVPGLAGTGELLLHASASGGSGGGATTAGTALIGLTSGISSLLDVSAKANNDPTSLAASVDANAGDETTGGGVLEASGAGLEASVNTGDTTVADTSSLDSISGIADAILGGVGLLN